MSGSPREARDSAGTHSESMSGSSWYGSGSTRAGGGGAGRCWEFGADLLAPGFAARGALEPLGPAPGAAMNLTPIIEFCEDLTPPFAGVVDVDGGPIAERP